MPEISHSNKMGLGCRADWEVFVLSVLSISISEPLLQGGLWKGVITNRLCMMQIHLFDIDVPGKITFQESKTLSPGDSLSTFDTRTYHISLPLLVVIPEKSKYFSFYVCPQLFPIALLEVQNGGKQTV